VLEAKPLGCEGVDNTLLEDMKAVGIHKEYLSMLPDGHGFLLVEFGGETKDEADDQAHKLMARLKKGSGAVVDPYPITSNLRLGVDYRPPKVKTHFAFPNDHGSSRTRPHVASGSASAAARTEASCARASWSRARRSTRRAVGRARSGRC
jgi:hypothetical protein